MSDTRMDDPLEIIPNRVRGYQLVERPGQQLRVHRHQQPLRRRRHALHRPRPAPLRAGASTRASSSRQTSVDADVRHAWPRPRAVSPTTASAGRPIPSTAASSSPTAARRTRRAPLLYNFPAQNFALAAASNFENANPDAYVARLFQILTDEPLNVSAYTGDRAKDALYRGLDDTYKWGLLQYTRTGHPLSRTEEEAGAAFAYFNTNLSARLSPRTCRRRRRRSARAGTLRRASPSCRSAPRWPRGWPGSSAPNASPPTTAPARSPSSPTTSPSTSRAPTTRPR